MAGRQKINVPKNVDPRVKKTTPQIIFTTFLIQTALIHCLCNSPCFYYYPNPWSTPGYSFLVKTMLTRIGKKQIFCFSSIATMPILA